MFYSLWRAAACILARANAGSSTTSCSPDQRLKMTSSIGGSRLSVAHHFGIPGCAPSGPVRWAAVQFLLLSIFLVTFIFPLFSFQFYDSNLNLNSVL
jgi:hypothetical protein